jgi:hypothetical protein
VVNFEPARRPKFKIFQKPEIRAIVIFRASSKIEIQNFLNPNFEFNFEPARRSKIKISKTQILSWSWISSQLEDQNVKKIKKESQAGFEFRASSKIEIQNFKKSNFELEMNFDPARGWKFKFFKNRISSWSLIFSQLEERNLKFSKTRIST